MRALSEKVLSFLLVMVTFTGSHATINRKPGQARKGAATAVASCAEV